MKKLLVGLGVLAFGYVAFKMGYNAGSFDNDPVCKELYKKYSNNEISFDEYLDKVCKRKEELGL